MQIRGNRTFICSVVFIDIVEYTRKAVTEQIQVKERLNALLAEALKDVAANDRIILDTGDGAAISFVGDPEDALFVCLSPWRRRGPEIRRRSRCASASTWDRSS
jgi:hypothetical protein